MNATMSKKLKCESDIGQTFSLGSMCGPGETCFDPDLTRGRVATYVESNLNKIAHSSEKAVHRRFDLAFSTLSKNVSNTCQNPFCKRGIRSL